MRSSSASTPPMMKKTNEVTPYRIPIRLWSTVVSHDTRPCVAFGRRKNGWRVGTAIDMGLPCYERPCRPSFQAPQVLDQRLDLILVQVVVRHVGAGLHPWGVGQPLGQSVLRVGKHPGGDRLPACQVCEVRTRRLRWSRGAADAGDGVTGEAGGNHLFGEAARLGSRRLGELALNPT